MSLRPIRAWLAPVALAGLFSVAFVRLGVPSAVLFGSLLGGVGYAVAGSRPLVAPRGLFLVGQAIIGAAIGALVDVAALATLRSRWPAVAAVCLGTLALSLLIGQGLRLHGISPATAAFSFVAGGASGIVAVARDLGADDRVVAVVQYLRVVLIVAGMPLVAAVVFHPAAQSAPRTVPEPAGLGGNLVFVVIIVTGLGLARLTRMPAGAVLGPLTVSVVLGASGAVGAVRVPGVVEQAGYALVGLLVGLRFTRSSLVRVARILPTACVLIVVLGVASAGLGVLLSVWTGVSRLDGYLATTPGGLFAVLATAADTGADVTFVLAVQVARLLVMVAAAPLVAALFRPAAGSPP